MATTAPGVSTVKPRGRVDRFDQVSQLDDDPTDYPDWEAVGRDPTESVIVRHFEPVVIRHQAERGIVCYVGSDNFIYWVKGNNKACVSPDLYILPDVLPTEHPRKLEGSKDEGCWKTWLLGVVPNFALEVKAFKNARKDELQAPERHDALGTKELIVFDPYWKRRRVPRKRFCVQRRDAAGKLVVVAETNDDRVYSEVLEAFIVAEGANETARLRLGLGPNGENLLPFESERVDMEARRADEQARRADEQARRVSELEAELAQLRASIAQQSK